MENPTDTTDTHHTPDAHSFARWVRAVDRLLWQERAAALTADDIGPRDARVLHVLTSDHASKLLAHLSHGGKRLRRLAERGWVAEANGTWSLTDAGRAAADRLAQRTEELTARLSEAVSSDELAAASTTLEAVARTLGWREGESREGHAHHPGGFGPRAHRFGHGRHGFGPGEHGFGPRERLRGGVARHGDGFVDRDARRADAESAYERGFAAGFAEGRTAASA